MSIIIIIQSLSQNNGFSSYYTAQVLYCSVEVGIKRASFSEFFAENGWGELLKIEWVSEMVSV
jgi:hypothetical protein